MRFSLVLAALLCVTTWMGVVHATHAPVSSCCLGWTNKRFPPKRIMDYTLQTEGVCSITAIVFQRKSGAKICSDPNSDWAKKVILKVDEEKKQKLSLQEKRQNEGLTSDVTPTVSRPLTNTPQKKGRNGSRRQKKKSRGGRRGQKKCV